MTLLSTRPRFYYLSSEKGFAVESFYQKWMGVCPVPSAMPQKRLTKGISAWVTGVFC